MECQKSSTLLFSIKETIEVRMQCIILRWNIFHHQFCECYSLNNNYLVVPWPYIVNIFGTFCSQVSLIYNEIDIFNSIYETNAQRSWHFMNRKSVSSHFKLVILGITSNRIWSIASSNHQYCNDRKIDETLANFWNWLNHAKSFNSEKISKITFIFHEQSKNYFYVFFVQNTVFAE